MYVFFFFFISGHRELLTGGAWSTTRFSVFFLTKIDGTLDVWDLLVQQDAPVLSVKVIKYFIFNDKILIKIII